MKEFLMQTYTIVLPILMGYIVWLLQNQKKSKDAVSKGTMLLLRERLIDCHDKYMERETIPSWVYEHFCEMYEVYDELGGNGVATKMKSEIDELHLRERVR